MHPHKGFAYLINHKTAHKFFLPLFSANQHRLPLKSKSVMPDPLRRNPPGYEFHITEPERFYHGFVLGLMVDLADRYRITSNRESGLGRYDVMLEPLRAGDPAFVLEFKVRDPEDEASTTIQYSLLHPQVTTGQKQAPDSIGIAVQLAEYNLFVNPKEEVRAWYDGFTFGETPDIYNPWSIIHYLDKGRFAAYWANTSSNSLVGKLMPKHKTVVEPLRFCSFRRLISCVKETERSQSRPVHIDIHRLFVVSFAAYWANTSSNSLVGKLIREGEAEVKTVMEDLLQRLTLC